MRWVKVYMMGGMVIGTGLLLYKYIRPTDEELIARFSPELRLQYEREKGLRRAEQEALMRVVRQTSESNDPIWMTGPIKSPWEINSDKNSYKGTNVSSQSDKQFAEQRQIEELNKVQQELELLRQDSEKRTQEIVNEKSKWKFW